MKQTFDELSVITLDSEGHARTCNYWYLVRCEPYAHTAFTHREHLLKWLEERKLELTEPLPEHKVFSSQRVKGKYSQESHMTPATLPQDFVLESRTMSNGEYVTAWFTEDEGGYRTQHELNPNYHDRTVYDYQESRASHG